MRLIIQIVAREIVKRGRPLHKLIQDEHKTCRKLRQQLEALLVRCHLNWPLRLKARVSKLHHQRSQVRCQLLIA